MSNIVDEILDFLSGGHKRLQNLKNKESYHLFEFDLSTARNDEEITYYGDQLIVTNIEDQAYIRLNDIENSLIDLKYVRNFNTAIEKFFLTNEAGSGDLKILGGSGGIFKSNSVQIVDIIGQDIDRVTVREHGGLIESSNDETVVIAGSGAEHDFIDISGKGSLIWFFLYCSTANSTSIKPKIYIDNTLLEPCLTFSSYSSLGMSEYSRPFQLLDYNVGAMCSGAWYFENGIVFDTSLKLSAQNLSINNNTVTAYWFYQLIS